MKTKYAKLSNNKLEYFQGKVLKINKKVIFNPNEKSLLEVGYLKVPEVDTSKHISHWELNEENKLQPVYTKSQEIEQITNQDEVLLSSLSIEKPNIFKRFASCFSKKK